MTFLDPDPEIIERMRFLDSDMEEIVDKSFMQQNELKLT